MAKLSIDDVRESLNGTNFYEGRKMIVCQSKEEVIESMLYISTVDNKLADEILTKIGEMLKEDGTIDFLYTALENYFSTAGSKIGISNTGEVSFSLVPDEFYDYDLYYINHYDTEPATTQQLLDTKFIGYEKTVYVCYLTEDVMTVMDYLSNCWEEPACALSGILYSTNNEYKGTLKADVDKFFEEHKGSAISISGTGDCYVETQPDELRKAGCTVLYFNHGNEYPTKEEPSHADISRGTYKRHELVTRLAEFINDLTAPYEDVVLFQKNLCTIEKDSDGNTYYAPIEYDKETQKLVKAAFRIIRYLDR